MKRLFGPARAVLCLLAAFLIFTIHAVLPVSANAPAPRFNFDIRVTNAPEGAYAVDFLVPGDLIPDGIFTELNREGLGEAGFPEDCELALYDRDGYVSWLTHAEGARPQGILKEAEGFLYVWQYSEAYDLITRSDTDVRLALVDAGGGILCVSEPFSPAKSTPRHYYGDITYDAASGAVEAPQPADASKDGDPMADKIIYSFVIVLMLMILAVVTMLIELGIAALFRLKPVWHVLWVNLISNLVFNTSLLYFCWLRYPPLPYVPFVAAGEAAVMLIEFLIYTRIYRERKAGVLLVYSVVANLVSCLLALFASAVLFG